MGGTPALSPDLVARLLARADEIGVTAAARELGVCRDSVYRWRERGVADRGRAATGVASHGGVVREGQQAAIPGENGQQPAAGGGESVQAPRPKPRGAGLPTPPPPLPVRRYSLADRRVAKRWVVATDVHFGCHDDAAVDVLYQAVAIIRPDGYADLGDVGESQEVSRHRDTRGAPADYLVPEYDAARDEINGHLDARDRVLDGAGVRERVQLTGNHDLWWDKLADADPRNRDYAFAVAFRFAARRFVCVPHGVWHPLAPGLLATHGDCSTATIGHPRALLVQAGGASVLYGHHHALSLWYEPGRDPLTGENTQRRSYCLGTLKDRRHDANRWLRGITHRWGQAFGIVDVYGDGAWSVQVVEIHEGRCSLWGEVLTARERRAA